MAFFYDIYGAVRHVFKMKKTFVFVFDSLFFVLLAVAFFTALYITCGGKLRWFVVAGLMFGLFIYIFGASVYVRPMIEKQLMFFLSVLKKILLAFLFPLKQIWRLFRFICAPILKIVHSALNKVRIFGKITIEKQRCFVIKLIRYILR